MALVDQIARRCDPLAVEWQLFAREAGGNQSGERLVRAGDLCLLGQATPAPTRSALLRSLSSATTCGLFIAPDFYAPLTRLVVLCHDSLPGAEFLQQMVALCRALGAGLSLLAAARSISKAQALQDLAREALGGYGIACEFDLLAGRDVPAAVATMARLRRCQVVAVERRDVPAWSRWFRLNAQERFINLLDGLGVLTLPGVGVAAAAAQSVSAAPEAIARTLEPSQRAAITSPSLVRESSRGSMKCG
jgi:hypothetical protein